MPPLSHDAPFCSAASSAGRSPASVRPACCPGLFPVPSRLSFSWLCRALVSVMPSLPPVLPFYQPAAVFFQQHTIPEPFRKVDTQKPQKCLFVSADLSFFLPFTGSPADGPWRSNGCASRWNSGHQNQSGPPREAFFNPPHTSPHGSPRRQMRRSR